jgi:hypothetical protein
MAPKVLIRGTSYNIISGNSLVNGTSYNIINGKTLVDGTAYNINFAKPQLRAMLYSDKNMIFQYGGAVIANKILRKSYIGFDNKVFTSQNSIPWNYYKSDIKYVSFANNISTHSMTFWFHNSFN